MMLHHPLIFCVFSYKWGCYSTQPPYSHQIQDINIDILLPSNHAPHSNFFSCSNMSLIAKESRPGSHITWSCQVSLVSFKLEYFLSLPLTFMTLIWQFGTLQMSNFSECLSIWVCLIFPLNLRHIRQECHQMITQIWWACTSHYTSQVVRGCNLSH